MKARIITLVQDPPKTELGDATVPDRSSGCNPRGVHTGEDNWKPGQIEGRPTTYWHFIKLASASQYHIVSQSPVCLQEVTGNQRVERFQPGPRRKVSGG